MNRIARYARKRFSNLETELISYQHIPEIETLHRIRVEIKKIKALLRLIKYCTRKFKAHKTFVQMRSMFREAGEIRQPEVFYRLLLLYQIKGVRDEAVPNARRTARLSAAYIKLIPEHLETVTEQRKVVEKSARKVTRDCIEKYVRRRKKELRSELYPSLQLDNLHQSRKTMKEIIYLSGLGKGGRKKQNRFYRDLETLVGQWHDRQMLTFELIRHKTTAEVKRLTNENEADIRRIRRMVRRHYQ